MSRKIKNYTTDPLVQQCIKDGVPLSEILLVDCPYCHHETYYSGGFTSICSWCGEDCASASENARSVSDTLYMEAADEYRQSHADRSYLDFDGEVVNAETKEAK